SEVVSSSQAKAEASRSLITQSLEETRDFLKLKPHGDPSKGFYQYANRLAHLYLLRGLNGIPAFLVFVYFVNDHTHVRTTEDEWNGALQLMHCITGTQKHKLTKYIVDIFVDVPTL
ncbi:MAG: hypothetical protein SWE60_23560, partial [Thermodesulfobacteriota bacterium]|nr:hypothetical protein [Thermodesulfobacteriota bacterium]